LVATWPNRSPSSRFSVQFIFEQIRCGGDRNFGYLIGDRDAGKAVLIDPSYSPETFVQRAVDQRLTVTHIINTHGHPDHTNGNTRATELTSAPVAAFAASTLVRADVGLVDEQVLEVGGLRLQFLHLPGLSLRETSSSSERWAAQAATMMRERNGQACEGCSTGFLTTRPSGPATTTGLVPVPRSAWSVR
jgi:hypothetical protein